MMRKSTVLLIIVIVLTLGLGAGAIYFALKLQKQKVSPEKGKAAETETVAPDCNGQSPPAGQCCCEEPIVGGCDKGCIFPQDHSCYNEAQAHPGVAYIQDCESNGSTRCVELNQTECASQCAGIGTPEGQLCTYCNNRVWKTTSFDISGDLGCDNPPPDDNTRHGGKTISVTGDVRDVSTQTSANGNWFISGLVIERNQGTFTVTAPEQYVRSECPSGCASSPHSCTCPLPVGGGGFNFAIPYPSEEWNQYCQPSQSQCGNCGQQCCQGDNPCESPLECQNGVCKNPNCPEQSNCLCEVPPPGECGGDCGPSSACAQGLTCIENKCKNPQCPYDPDCICSPPPSQNPSCTALNIEGKGLVCSSGSCEAYQGTTLNLKVSGNPAANVTRFSYCSGGCDEGSDWHNIPGGLERGDWTYNEGTSSGISWVIPSDQGEGNWGLWGGIGFVPTPSDGNLGNDIMGRLCGGNNETNAWVSGNPTYVPCDINYGNCTCTPGPCYKQIKVIKPPSCDSLEFLAPNCTDPLSTPVHPNDSVCMKVTGTAGSGETVASYRHGYELSNGAMGVFTPDPTNGSTRVITIKDIPGYDESVTYMYLGASVIDSNNFECDGYGQLVNMNTNQVVGQCTSDCRKYLELVRTPSLKIDKFVKEINSNPPTTSCKDPAEKQCQSDSLSVGANVVKYLVRLTNNGEAVLHNVVLTDFVLLNGNPPSGEPLPWKITSVQPLRECADSNCSSYGSGSSAGTINNGGLDASWGSIDIPPGAIWQAELMVETSGGVVSSGRFDNIAKVTSNEFCQSPTGCIDDVYHLMGSSVSISLNKVSDSEAPDRVQPGDSVEFTVTVTNNVREIQGVEVTDYLGDNFEDYFIWPPSPINVTTGSYITDQTSHTIVWTIPSLNGTETMTFTATVDPDLQLNPPDCMTMFENRVAITKSTEGVILPPTENEWVIIEDPVCGVSTGWRIEKKGTPQTVAPEGAVVFELKITNIGDQGDYVTSVRDTLPSGFTYQNECVVIKPDGSSFTCTPAVSGQTLEWAFPTTGSNSVYVKPNENMVITFKVKAPVAPGTYVNIACLVSPGDGCDDAVIYVSGGKMPGTAVAMMFPITVTGGAMVLTGAFVIRRRIVGAWLYEGYAGLTTIIQKVGKKLLPSFEERVEKTILKKRREI